MSPGLRQQCLGIADSILHRGDPPPHKTVRTGSPRACSLDQDPISGLASDWAPAGVRQRGGGELCSSLQPLSLIDIFGKTAVFK